MTRHPLVPVTRVPSCFPQYKPPIPDMKTNSANCPAAVHGATRGGDYLAEGMAVVQQMVTGSLTPVA